MKRTLHDTKSAAKYLGLAPQTLNKWRCTGGGPEFIKMGGAVRYDEADLEQFLEGARRTNTSGVPA